MICIVKKKTVYSAESRIWRIFTALYFKITMKYSAIKRSVVKRLRSLVVLDPSSYLFFPNICFAKSMYYVQNDKLLSFCRKRPRQSKVSDYLECKRK